jgi:hypothetical protein
LSKLNFLFRVGETKLPFPADNLAVSSADSSDDETVFTTAFAQTPFDYLRYIRGALFLQQIPEIWESSKPNVSIIIASQVGNNLKLSNYMGNLSFVRCSE